MKRGDEAAFDAFVRKYYEMILNYCSFHCPDRTYAEDLTQETFVRFLAKLSDYHYMDKTKNYLYTIAGNLCRDYYRKTKELLSEEPPRENAESKACPETEGILDRLTLEAALKKLPAELREVLILYYFQDLKLSEIADILEISLSLVKYRMGQARRKLEQLLKEV